MYKIIFPVFNGMHSNAFLFVPSFTLRLKCLLDSTHAFSKTNPGRMIVFGPFLKKIDISPLSLIQVRTPVILWPTCEYRNGESERDHDD